MVAAALIGASSFSGVAWAGVADIEGSVRYEISGDQMTIEIDRIKNNTTGTMSEQIHVTAFVTTESSIFTRGHIVARGAIDRDRFTGQPISGILGPGQYFFDNRFELDYDAPPPGTYYMHIFTSQHPDLNTVLDHVTMSGRLTVGGGTGCGTNDRREDATQLDLNERREGSMCREGDVDYFRLDVPSRGRLVAETEGSLDMVGVLEDEDGERVASDDDGGAGVNFRIEEDLRAGRYYLRVNEYGNDETGDYTLITRWTADEPGCGGDDHGDLRRNATEIDLDVEVDGVICPSDDVDYFRFEIPSRGEISAAVDADRDLGTAAAHVEDTDGHRVGYDIVDAGTYYAKVVGANDYDENPTGSYTLTVGHTPRGPDLVVESPGVDDASIKAGASSTLSARVSNEGGDTADATTLRYYRSADATISTGDTAVGTDSVGRLVAGSSSSESIQLTAPNAAGTYYYGACVDAVADESDRSNNCSDGVRVTVSGGGTGGGGGGGTGGGGGGGDGTSGVTPSLRLGDLNGDRHDDVLLRHTGNGQWIYYAMDRRGGTLHRNLGLTTNRDWEPAGVGDLDGDGYDDLLMRHASNGQWLYYRMDGRRGRLVRNLGLTPNRDFRFAGLGDFNGDGYDDVMLRHTTNGEWIYYAMDGDHGRLVRNFGATPNRAWVLAGVGDMDGDGHDDLLLRHADNGQWLYYDMGGSRARLVRLGLTPNQDWRLAGLGDLDGDGDDDVLLRHAGNGEWIYYAMDGGRGTLVRSFGATANAAWGLAGIGDVNGDGHDDLVLRHADNGQWLYYDMGGSRARLVRVGLTSNRDWSLPARAETLERPNDGGDNETPTGVNFVGVGIIEDGGRWRSVIAASQDGTSWSWNDDVNKSTARLRDVAFGDGLWIVVGGKHAFLSSDGRNWSHTSFAGLIGSNDGCVAVTYANGRWVVLCSSYILTSTNGRDWSRAAGSPSSNFRSVDYGEGLWVARGDIQHDLNQSGVIESSDGINWHELPESEVQFPCRGNRWNIVFGSARWYSIGEETSAVCPRSPSGTWGPWIGQRAQDGRRIDHSWNSLSSADYGNGVWISVSDGEELYAWRDDASRVRRVVFAKQLSSKPNVRIYSVVYGQDRWVIGSRDGPYYNVGDPENHADWVFVPPSQTGGEALVFEGLGARR